MSTTETTAPAKPTFEAFGQTFTVERKPPILLVSELARTNSDDPEAAGVLADFFTVTLGREEYRKFKSAAYAADDPDAATFEAVGKIIEVTATVPTK